MPKKITKDTNVIWNWDNQTEQKELRQLSLAIRRLWSGEINIREANDIAFPISNRLRRSRRVTAKLSKLSKIIDNRKTFNALIKRGIAEDTPEALLRVVHSSPNASKLLIQAQKVFQQSQGTSQQLQLHFVDKVEFDAEYDFVLGSVNISIKMPFKKKISSFLFELTNVINYPEYKIAYDTLKQLGASESYVTCVEHMEYQGCKKGLDVLDRCEREDGWFFPEEMRGPLIKWESFAEYLQVQEATGHTQYYRDGFKNPQQGINT